MTSIHRRKFLTTSAATGALLTLPWSARAARYPDRPVRLVVPFAVGGAADILGRIYALSLTERLGQSVVVDNRPGSGGLIGATTVAKSSADGYTLLLSSLDTLVLQPSLRKTSPYHPDRDFSALAGIASTPITFAASNGSGITSLAGLKATAAAKPGVIRYGSPGVGTIPHLAAELFCKTAGIQLTHVAYRGGGPAMVDLMGNHIELIVSVPADVADKHRSGACKVLAQCGARRLALLSDVPTMIELGYKSMDVGAWFALAAPSGMSADVGTRLRDEALLVLDSRAFNEQIARQGFERMAVDADSLGKYVASERQRWTGVIQAANLSLLE